jgi:predicted nucleic acid-binding Zn ribbon protein
MKRLDEWLSVAVERREVLREARCQSALAAWSDVVGPQIAAHTVPERVEKGTVWVAATGSAWAQELRMRAQSVIEGLNASAGEPGLFVGIRVGVRPPRRNLDR